MVLEKQQVILELIEANSDIIESKKNYGRTIDKKEKTWDEIVVKFNARHGVTAQNKKQLKAAWKNFKTKAKKEVANKKKEQRKTGGGKCTPDISKNVPKSCRTCATTSQQSGESI